MAQFSKLPPQERVKRWLKEGGYFANSGFLGGDMENELVVGGLDTVPHLAEIVRRGKGYQRLGALKLLCKMDRFVPTERLPEGVPGQPLFGESEPVGILDMLMVVDGRRIGKEGAEAVRWAAEQTEHDDLRFHAREYSGLLKQEISKLSLEEQLRQWRNSAAKCKGYPGMNDDCRLNELVGYALSEKGAEVIPALIHMLEQDANPYVREEASSVLVMIDRFSMRLRGTEVGRRAIEAMRQAHLRCNHKPYLNERETCEGNWRDLSAQFFKDERAMNFNWMTALDQLYGLGIKDKQLWELSPEGRRFVTYLTEVDPYFPGWEFYDHTLEYALHPRFKAKWERYYEHWKRFKASEGVAVPTSNNTPAPQPR